VFLLRPLAGVGLGRERAAGLLVQVRPGVLLPGREREAPGGPADARELVRSAVVVGREDHAEGRRDAVELGVSVRKLLGVPLVEAGHESGIGRGPACLLDLVRGDVDADDVGAGAGRPQRNTARTAANVEQTDSRAGRKRGDDAVVDRREGLGEPLVARATPGLGG